MWTSHVAPVSIATSAAAALMLVASPSAFATPPSVEAFDVSFPETSCTNVTDDIIARLSVRFTDNRQPDGTVHHWIDLSGTITNEVTGDQVRLRATRRFFDNEPDDQSRFAGLQSRFSAHRHGVLQLNAGWASGALSESVVDYATRGRWDGIEAALPTSVCRVLAGG